MKGMWEEEANIIPTYGRNNYYLGYDLALSGDSSIIGYHCDYEMGFCSGSINVFFIRDSGTWGRHINSFLQSGMLVMSV